MIWPVYFIYRSWYEGPASKVVRRFPDTTVLSWFQDSLRQTRGLADEDVRAWLERELGADVYGLPSFFTSEAPVPETMSDLRTALREHLYVEQCLHADDHSVRVLTDDDEVDLAYYFIDDAAVAAEPERWAFAVHDAWRLPDSGAGDGTVLAPTSLHADVTLGPGPGAVHVIVLSYSGSSHSVARSVPIVLRGVRLPQLAQALRDADADEDLLAWDLVALRAMVAPGDTTIEAALRLLNHWPISHNPTGHAYISDEVSAALAGDHAAAHAFALDHLGTAKHLFGREPSRTKIHVGAHLAQMAIHVGRHSGYFQ